MIYTTIKIKIIPTISIIWKTSPNNTIEKNTEEIGSAEANKLPCTAPINVTPSKYIVYAKIVPTPIIPKKANKV